MRAHAWREFAPCPSFAYEYHFWKHQFYAPCTLTFARRIYEDVLSYKANGFDGIIEDGSQRSFFPNGFNYYVYAQTLFDNTVDFEALKQDYFTHAYGDLAPEVLSYLEQLDERLCQRYLEKIHSLASAKDHYYKPHMVKPLREVEQIATSFAALLDAHAGMPMRAQTVAVRLMRYFTEF